MTLYYPDVSNNQWQNASDAQQFVAQLAPEGFSAICHKVSEGNYYRDTYWPVVRDAAAAAGLPCLGYHYVTTNDAAQQAQAFIANGGGKVAMLDFEANSGDIGNFWAVVNAFNALGVEILLSYIPRWYWQQIGSPSLTSVPGLVSSAYPGGTGYASAIYENDAGDGGSGWNSYGGATPVAWQFTDRAMVAGISVDCNAFKGDAAQLAALFGTAPAAPAPAPAPSPTPEGNTNVNAGPQDVMNHEEGVSGDGTPQWFDVVQGRADQVANFLIANGLKGPWNEPLPNGMTSIPGPDGQPIPPGGTWDMVAHGVLAAEALSWRYVDSTGRRVDLPFIMMVLWEWLRSTVPASTMEQLIAAATTARSATS